MGAKKFYVAHGHVYLDDDQGRAVQEYEICARCGDGDFFLACEVCNDGDDDVNHLVTDLANFVNFNDEEIHVDDTSERDEFEDMSLVFDTQDRTQNFMVIAPEETETDDDSGNDNDNIANRWNFTHRLFLSHSHFHPLI